MVAVCGVTMLSSCHDNDLFDPANVAKEYADNWVKKYGEIDPEQDWNSAKAGTLNINVSGAGSGYVARVYSGNPHEPGEISLLAKYNVRVGENNINFDFPAGMSQVYVSLTGNKGFVGTKCVGIGETVTFDAAASASARVRATATRTAVAGDFEITDYEIFTEKEIKQIVESLPEEESAADKFNDYEFVSNGEFIIYPVYGKTGSIETDEIGYYYYDPSAETIDSRHEVTLVSVIKKWISSGSESDNDFIQMKAYYSYDYFNGNGFVNDQETEWTNYLMANDVDQANKKLETKYTSYDWGKEKIEYALRAKGYAINIPAGYRVGFWIKNGDNKLYSNRKLNDDGLYYSAVKTHQNGDMYFGLEDWKQNTDNHALDCNDIVFFVKNSGSTPPPTPVTPDKPQSWIIACEDLGDTDDFDFNDVVFEVTHVSGATTATVTPLAAGGVYSANIGFLQSDGSSTELGEIHDLLGKSIEDGKQPMLNTGGEDGFVGTPKTVAVPEDYSLAFNPNGGVTSNMGGFYIQVKSNMNQMTTLVGSTKGEAPQMILVPGTWKWPKERTSIEKAYPNFNAWSENYQSNTDWYNYTSDNSLLYQR